MDEGSVRLGPQRQELRLVFRLCAEENSLLLGFDARRVELPAIDLVFDHRAPCSVTPFMPDLAMSFRFAFDFLDTMGGGNLSFQVHPLTEYIQQHFGMHYTQDESYYLLEAGPDANSLLGPKEGVDPAAMLRDLQAAQAGALTFPLRSTPISGRQKA
jgi:hypothetical protein